MSARSLEEALKYGDCPICRLMGGDAFQFVAKSQLRWATDDDAQTDLAERGGFCNCHAELIRKVMANRELCLMYVKLIDRMLGELADPRFHVHGMTQQVRCPVCEAQDESRERWTRELLTQLAEKTVREMYAMGRGLCVPHLVHALRSADDEQRDWLLALQREQLQRLRGDAVEFARKHDALLRGEMTRSEKLAAQDLVTKFAGSHGVVSIKG